MEGGEAVGRLLGVSWKWAWRWEGEKGVMRALAVDGSGDGVGTTRRASGAS